MKQRPVTSHAINDECITIMRNGGLAIFPTETLYGLGCIATNEDALQHLFKVKARKEGQPPPVLVSNAQQLWSLIASCNDTASALIQAHWPGFVTLILPARAGLSPLLTGFAADGSTPTIGVRMTAHPIARALCEGVGEPIVATSANISGATGQAANQHAIEDISTALISQVDIIVDGGAVRGEPSTVVDCTGTTPRILRQGALQISLDELSPS